MRPFTQEIIRSYPLVATAMIRMIRMMMMMITMTIILIMAGGLSGAWRSKRATHLAQEAVSALVDGARLLDGHLLRHLVPLALAQVRDELEQSACEEIMGEEHTRVEGGFASKNCQELQGGLQWRTTCVIRESPVLDVAELRKEDPVKSNDCR